MTVARQVANDNAPLRADRRAAGCDGGPLWLAAALLPVVVGIATLLACLRLDGAPARSPGPLRCGTISDVVADEACARRSLRMRSITDGGGAGPAAADQSAAWAAAAWSSR